VDSLRLLVLAQANSLAVAKSRGRIVVGFNLIRSTSGLQVPKESKEERWRFRVTRCNNRLLLIGILDCIASINGDEESAFESAIRVRDRGGFTGR